MEPTQASSELDAIKIGAYTGFQRAGHNKDWCLLFRTGGGGNTLAIETRSNHLQEVRELNWLSVNRLLGNGTDLNRNRLNWYSDRTG